MCAKFDVLSHVGFEHVWKLIIDILWNNEAENTKFSELLPCCYLINFSKYEIYVTFILVSIQYPAI